MNKKWIGPGILAGVALCLVGLSLPTLGGVVDNLNAWAQVQPSQSVLAMNEARSVIGQFPRDGDFDPATLQIEGASLENGYLSIVLKSKAQPAKPACVMRFRRLKSYWQADPGDAIAGLGCLASLS